METKRWVNHLYQHSKYHYFKVLDFDNLYFIKPSNNIIILRREEFKSHEIDKFIKEIQTDRSTNVVDKVPIDS
jgi:hypothetical protein